MKGDVVTIKVPLTLPEHFDDYCEDWRDGLQEFHLEEVTLSNEMWCESPEPMGKGWQFLSYKNAETQGFIKWVPECFIHQSRQGKLFT
jgi:hypothetical protein